MSTIASTGGGGSSGQASTGSASTGGGGSSAAAFTWGDGWRNQMAAGTTDVEKELKQLERYASPEEIWRKSRELERKMSAGELRSSLKKDATSEEIARWRQENGIPAKPEEYKVNMPAGRQPPKEDDAFLKSFLKSAHEQNFTQPQVDAAIKTFYSEVDRQMEEATANEKALIQKTDDALHVAWGKDYRLNKNMAEQLLDRAPAGFKDRFLNGYLADQTPIRADVASWQWLVQLEREINPAGTVVAAAGGEPGKAVGDRIAEIKEMMKNRNGPYYKGAKAEALQEEYRQLLEAEQKMRERGKAA